MSGLTSLAVVGDERARRPCAFFCRQTWRVRFMICRSLTCSSAARGGRSRTSSGSLCRTGGLPSPVYSQAATWQKLLVVAHRLAVRGLVLLAEVAAARLVALERVAGTSARRARGSRPRGRPSRATGSAPRPSPEHVDVLPELLAQRRDLLRARVFRPCVVAGHAAVVPHDLAELAVEASRPCACP